MNNPQWIPNESPPEDDFSQYYSYVVNQSNLLNIIQYFNLQPVNISTSTWSHKLICPFPFHKNGKERTPSFYIDSTKNRFNCFGCNEYGNAVKFIELLKGCPRGIAIKYAAKISGLLKDNNFNIDLSIIQTPQELEKPNDFIYIKTNAMLRDYLLSCSDKNKTQETKWVDSIFNKMDEYSLDIDEFDCESVEKIYNQIYNLIQKRKKKK